MDTTLRDPLVGQVLDGRYRVEARIAVGGMATVYRAVDTRLDRVIALKVMHPTLAADGAFVDRFIREAKSVARLAHANVVGVFDQGADAGHVYLAMEYVAGCTLRDLLRERGALQPRAALDILEPVLAALGAAHRAGFVHRDMKPENVLIGDDGRVKVADFGLVRAVDTATQSSASTGSVLGTVSYLAPEQIEHGTADTRADVYACGVVLYEMLTGGKPHGGSTPAQVLYQHLHQDVPPPSAAVPGLPPVMDDLVLRAAARDPELRPTDAVGLLGLAREARGAMSAEELDAVPPQARSETHDGSEDRTSVIPRAVGGPVSGDLHHTTRLDVPADADGPGHRAPSRDRMPRRPVLTLVTAVLLALGIGVGVWYINSGQFTKVPAVLDLSQSDAEHKLHDAGLGVTVQHRFNEAVAKGKVISTKPGVGARIRRHGTVTVAVSRGPQRTDVPNVVGMPLGQAKKKISDAGLSVSKVTRRFSDETPFDHVLSTDPKTGTRRSPDSPVSIVVSKGEPVDVPSVVGESPDDATSDLKDAGFKVKIAHDQVYSDQDKGSVATQSPSDDAQAAKGDTVTLAISKGQQMIKVPSVKGLSVDDAKKKLKAKGFDVDVDRPLFFPGDTVTDQSVDPGDTAPKGSTITIKTDGAF